MIMDDEGDESKQIAKTGLSDDASETAVVIGKLIPRYKFLIILLTII